MYTYPSPTRAPFAPHPPASSVQTFQNGSDAACVFNQSKSALRDGTLQKNGRAMLANYIPLRLFVAPQK
jgi:hypothetical protein